MSTMDFGMMLLEKGNVAVSPGSGFGPAGEGFLRMSLVENEARLRQAVRQIQRCLREAESAILWHDERRPLSIRFGDADLDGRSHRRFAPEISQTALTAPSDNCYSSVITATSAWFSRDFLDVCVLIGC